MDSSAGFIVTYGGEALRDHEIDICDLAPALLAIGKLFEDVNELVDGNRAQVRVYMKGVGRGLDRCLPEG